MHFVLVSGAIVTSWSTDRYTWKYGGASWRGFDADREFERALWEQKANAEPEPRLAVLREKLERIDVEARQWKFWRDLSAWSSIAILAISLLVLVLSRDVFSLASFLICLVAALFALGQWGIVF